MFETVIETDVSPTFKHLRVSVQAQYKDIKTYIIWQRKKIQQETTIIMKNRLHSFVSQTC